MTRLEALARRDQHELKRKRKLQPWYWVSDLAADWWWDEDYCYRALHGKTVWESATFSRGRSVRAMRFDSAAECARTRYFDPNQQVVLVPR